MNLFSERLRLAKEYELWLKENPCVKDCAMSVIGFLEGIGRLKDNSELGGDT